MVDFSDGRVKGEIRGGRGLSGVEERKHRDMTCDAYGMASIIIFDTAR